jgi:hypothetical protein
MTDYGCSCESNGGAGICPLHSPLAWIQDLARSLEWSERKGAPDDYIAKARHRLYQAAADLEKPLDEAIKAEVERVVQGLKYWPTVDLDFTAGQLQRLAVTRSSLARWRKRASSPVTEEA